jgi:hypothetical protein
MVADRHQIDGFIKLFRAYSPDVIFFDTLAAVTMGLSENDADTAAHLLQTGNLGTIVRELQATAVLAHHTGKDESRGGRGSSGFHGNADFYLALSIDKRARTSTVIVDKMRGGADGYAVHYGVDEVDGVGAAHLIDDAQAQQRRRTPRPVGAPKKLDEFTGGDVGRALQANGRIDSVTATSGELARWLAPSEDKGIIQAIKMRLNRGSAGWLEPYVACKGNGKNGSGTLWALPKRSLEAEFSDIIERE